MTHFLDGTKWNSRRVHHHTQNGVLFKTDKLFISGGFHVIFSDSGWPQVMKPQKVKPWVSVDYCTPSLSFSPSKNISSLFNSCPFFKICALYVSLMRHFLNALNQGFSTSAELPIGGHIIRCGKGLSGPCRMFYSILGLHPWGISSFSTPKWWRRKLFPDFAKSSLGDKVVPGGNHCSKQQSSFEIKKKGSLLSYSSEYFPRHFLLYIQVIRMEGITYYIDSLLYPLTLYHILLGPYRWDSRT